MNELMRNVAKHKGNNNPKICFFLISLMERFNLDTEEKIKIHEDNNFIDHDTKERPSDNEIIKELWYSFINDREHFDRLSVAEESELQDLYNEFNKVIDLDSKFIILIKIYGILDWGLVLPYHAYKYIMEDRLN